MICPHSRHGDSDRCSQCLDVRARRLDPVEVAPIRIMRTYGRSQINRHDFWARFWTQARSWRTT